MKNRLYILILVAFSGVAWNPAVQAMDDENKQLSPEMLMHVLSFEADKDISAFELRELAGLTQKQVNILFKDSVDKLDAEKAKIWLRFGPQVDGKNYLDYVFFVVSRKMQGFDQQSQGSLPEQYQEKRVFEFVKMFLELGGDSKNDPELLRVPAMFGWYKTVQYMLDHKIPINADALRFAVQYDHPETVQLLLDYGANPNVGVEFGGSDTRSPLYYAQSKQVARILLDAGAQLYVQCERGKKTTFSDMVVRAMETNNASMLIAVLKKHYGLQAATAIALALMAGASLAGMMCTIL